MPIIVKIEINNIEDCNKFCIKLRGRCKAYTTLAPTIIPLNNPIKPTIMKREIIIEIIERVCAPN